MSIFLRNLLLKTPGLKYFSILSENQQLIKKSCWYTICEIKPIKITNQQLFRNKYNKSTDKNKSEEESDSDKEFDNVQADKDSNIVKVTINSLRADLILKTGLGLARNKVETLFYESKIRVNGEKIIKKSIKLNIGDEVDIIKGISQLNSEHLVVARVEILKTVPKNESISVTLRKTRSLIIENYANSNVWKQGDIE